VLRIGTFAVGLSIEASKPCARSLRDDWSVLSVCSGRALFRKHGAELGHRGA
jgi:hypothetical protein